MNEFLYVVQLVITFLTAVILYLTLVKSIKMTKEAKAVDVALECQKRYDIINWDHRRLVEVGKLDVNTFFERFWNLQLAQFQYWTQGYISNEMYRSWMNCRYREWIRNEQVGERNYKDGWNDVKEYSGETEFAKFMGVVFSGDIDTAIGRKS